ADSLPRRIAADRHAVGRARSTADRVVPPLGPSPPRRRALVPYRPGARPIAGGGRAGARARKAARVALRREDLRRLFRLRPLRERPFPDRRGALRMPRE